MTLIVLVAVAVYSRRDWEEPLRPGQGKAGKGERQKEKRLFSFLDSGRRRRMVLRVTGEAEEARSLRTAGAVPEKQNPRWPHSTPRARGSAHRNGACGPCGSAQGWPQAWPGCPQLTFTMASNLDFWCYFQMSLYGRRDTEGARSYRSYSFACVSSSGGGICGALGIPFSEIPWSYYEYCNFVFSIKQLICQLGCV